MSTTPTSIRTRFPGQFDAPGVTDDVLNLAIAEAEALVAVESIGVENYDAAVMYLACDLVAYNLPGVSSGAVAMSSGSQSISFGSRPDGKMHTRVWDMYQRILESRVIPLFVA